MRALPYPYQKMHGLYKIIAFALWKYKGYAVREEEECPLTQEIAQTPKRKLLWQLFSSTFYISMFTFGGGFVIITFMKRKFVDTLHWIDEKEMLDLAALAQSSPGAIAVNAAILVGWRVGGALGMAVAVVGTILPPMIILSVISLFYAAFATNPYVALVLRGMQAGVAAVILGRGLQPGRGRRQGAQRAEHRSDDRGIPGDLCAGRQRRLHHPGRGAGGRRQDPCPAQSEEGGGEMMTLLELFWSFLQVGLFSIGGGYAAMPLIQAQVVEQHPWLTMSEFTDLITIAEMTPGPIAINSATFVGIRIAGLGGAVVATFGCILPSLLIVSILAKIYYKYKGAKGLDTVLSCLRPAVVALIAGAGLSILGTVLFGESAVALQNVDLVGAGLFVAAFFALRKLKWNPILVMSLCGVAGLGINLLLHGLPA